MKTVLPKAADDPSNIEILARSRFELAMRHFFAVSARISRGERVSTTETVKSDRIYHAASETLIQMRARLNEVQKSEAGHPDDYAVDLDDARDKVGRILDRIRATRGAGDVP